MSYLWRLKLVLEGGGSRAAYNAGILLALERAEVPCEVVVGGSTSAGNAAYFAAVQMEICTRIWTELYPDDFINYQRLVTPWGRPGLDLDRFIDDVLGGGWSRLDLAQATGGAPALYIVATAVPSGDPVIRRPVAGELLSWIRASAALPVGYNRVVRIEGQGYVDAGLSAPVPLDLPLEDAFSGPTVVVLTRFLDKLKKRPNWWQRAMLQTIVPKEIRGPSLRQHELYNKLVKRLREEADNDSIVLVSPPDDMPLARLTRDVSTLKAGIDVGLRVGRDLAEKLERL